MGSPRQRRGSRRCPQCRLAECGRTEFGRAFCRSTGIDAETAAVVSGSVSFERRGLPEIRRQPLACRYTADGQMEGRPGCRKADSGEDGSEGEVIVDDLACAAWLNERSIVVQLAQTAAG